MCPNCKSRKKQITFRRPRGEEKVIKECTNCGYRYKKLEPVTKKT